MAVPPRSIPATTRRLYLLPAKDFGVNSELRVAGAEETERTGPTYTGTMSNEPLILLSTCGSQEEARRLARELVERSLAACVNIVPGVESIYEWKGKVESAAELLLIIKTTSERRQALEEHLLSVHSYETPEVLYLSPNGGSAAYLKWLTANTR